MGSNNSPISVVFLLKPRPRLYLSSPWLRPNHQTVNEASPKTSMISIYRQCHVNQQMNNEITTPLWGDLINRPVNKINELSEWLMRAVDGRQCDIQAGRMAENRVPKITLKIGELCKRLSAELQKPTETLV